MNRLYRFSSWKRALSFLGLNFLVQAIILLVMYPQISQNLQPLDVQFGLTAEIVSSFLGAIGESGRSLYFLNELTLDMLFPVVYGLAYSLLIVQLVKAGGLETTRLKYLACLPLVLAGSDVLENIHILLAIHHFPELVSPVLQGIILFNGIKHGLTLVVLLVLLLLTIRVVGIRLSGQRIFRKQ